LLPFFAEDRLVTMLSAQQLGEGILGVFHGEQLYVTLSCLGCRGQEQD
jgi:hypothetical protein